MKKMNDKTKKWLIVTGCIAVCAVLVVLIGRQLRTQTPADAPISSQSSSTSDVTVNPDTNPAEDEKEVVVTPPAASQPDSTDNGAVSTGTEQTIQPDPAKPEYTEEQLTDPTQKPDGEKVTEPVPPVEHDDVQPPQDVPASKPSGGLPGFDNVPNAGANHGEVVDGDGDINKQVGTMD